MMNQNNKKFLDIHHWSGSEEKVKAYQKRYVIYFKGCRRVLDLGCGKGFFLELLKENGISGEGIDREEEMVKICCKKNLKVRQSDAISFLGDKKEEYDGIFCSHVIEHMYPRETLKLLELSFRALKGGGNLVIITPNFHDLYTISEGFWLDLTHIRPYPLLLLEKILVHSNFEIIAQGEDIYTGLRRNPLQKLFIKIRKLVVGNYWDRGDNFIVGKKE